MKKAESSVSVFDYTDYRSYLRAFYNERKRKWPAFSYRFFAQKAGLRSAGFYKDVVDGRKGLSQVAIHKFSKAMNHTREEAEYFENLVYFTEAKSAEQRQPFFDRMIMLSPSHSQPLNAAKFEYYTSWHYSAIRALISYCKIKDNFQQVAAMLSPPITPQQVANALDVLENLDLIRKNKAGYYVQTAPIITSPEQAKRSKSSMRTLLNLQNEFIRLAQEAYDRHPIEALDLSTLTLSISDESFKEIKKMLADLRKKVLRMSEMDKKAQKVVQLNMQFFPLTVSSVTEQA